MYLNTRIFPTTGYARVLLFMFIRRELGGMVQDVYKSLHTVKMISKQSESVTDNHIFQHSNRKLKNIVFS